LLNEALRLVRVYHDLSQTQLCLELGVSNSHLSEIEKGKKQPSLELLGRYSERFNIPVSSLLFFSEQLDSGSTGDKIRVAAAKKILALLNWVEKKDEGSGVGKKTGHKGAT
jgi:transcriptional regulator with XRE-family HTH domain